MTKQIYVKDLFEEKFIDKWLVYLYEVFYQKIEVKKYQDKDYMINEMRSLNERLAEFSDGSDKSAIIPDEFIEIVNTKINASEQYIYVDDASKYTFKIFQEQTEKIITSKNNNFIDDLHHLLLDRGSLGREVLTFNLPLEGENTKFSKYLNMDMLKVELPKEIMASPQVVTIYINWFELSLRVLKYIATTIFELETEVFKKDYEDYSDYGCGSIVQHIILCICLQSWHFIFKYEQQLPVLFAQSISNSLDIMTYIHEYSKDLCLDYNDKSRTLLWKNIEKMEKKNRQIYKVLCNLPTDRRKGNKSRKRNRVQEIRAKHSDAEILEYAQLISDYVYDHKFNIFQKEPSYELLNEYWKREKTKELKKYKNIELYFYNHSPKELAIAMFISKYEYNINAKTLSRAVSGYEPTIKSMFDW